MYTAKGLKTKEHSVLDYAPLVKRIAYQLMSKLPSSVEMDDVIQSGMMGLLDALKRYNGGNGAQFETYATQRIKGAILDELRSTDWVPRSLRREMRRIEFAIRQAQQKFGRHPTEIEIARELNISLDAYQQLLLESRGAQLLYCEDLHEAESDFFERAEFGGENDPEDLLHNERFKSSLSLAIDKLPERERLIMGLLYEQELNLREAGEVIGVSESRVSQLHSQAIARLRSLMSGH